MAKKKGKKPAAPLVPKKGVVTDWEQYMGKGELEDWQRLMRDLGFDEEFTSKTQCRVALKSVWVNIVDFLRATKHGYPVHHFESEQELAKYTAASRKLYPKNAIPKNSPLRKLLAHMPRPSKKGGGEDQLAVMMGGLFIAG